MEKRINFFWIAGLRSMHLSLQASLDLKQVSTNDDRELCFLKKFGCSFLRRQKVATKNQSTPAKMEKTQAQLFCIFVPFSAPFVHLTFFFFQKCKQRQTQLQEITNIQFLKKKFKPVTIKNKYKHCASTKGKQHDKYKHVITNENPNTTYEAPNSNKSVFYLFLHVSKSQ